MKVLTLNAGSSSLKYKLFAVEGLVLLASGAAERIGEAHNRLINRWRDNGGVWREREWNDVVADHTIALEHAFQDLADEGVLRDRNDLLGIGHRVVHGGERFVAPVVIDESALNEIRELESLAPLHNPANRRGIEIARRACPDVSQIAVFDTAFHHTLPPHASQYALPLALYERFHVRRYGFHGTSVAYVTREVARLMGRSTDSLNLIVLHLGNGASATAIENGKSIDTSMGMTPLEGLMMGTRCGDLDPAVPFHLLRHGGFTPESLEHLLEFGSGLKGVGGDNDLREIHARIKQGDEHAALALAIYCYRIKKYVGSYMAALGRVDAIVFTAGIGEHDAEVRARSLAGLEAFGITVDPAHNEANKFHARAIHARESKTEVWVIPTDEEREIARCVVALTQTRSQA